MGDRRRNHGGRKLLIAVALGPLCAAAADLPVHEVTSLAARAGGIPVPAFQRGYLYWLDHDTVRLYSPQGYPAFVKVLSVPVGTPPSADGLAVDSDGSVAVGVSYTTSSGYAGGIVFLDKNGIDIGFIDTGLYAPTNLSFGEDHSLWSFGWQRDPASPDRADRQDYPTVRHYTADRKEAARYLARSSFPKGLEPGMPSWQKQRITVSRDKVGLLAYSGKVGTSIEWVELDCNGNLLRRVPISLSSDLVGSEFAFTSDSHLYWKKEQRSDRLLVLNNTTPDWQDAGLSPGRQLMGADGDQLVFTAGGAGPVDLHWFAQPTSKGP